MIHINTKHDDFVSGLLLAVLLLTAVLIASPQEALAAESTLARIELAVEEKLGLDVVLHELTALPESEGAELELIWPGRDETCLPSLLKIRRGGRLVRSVSLRRFVEFELGVVVATGQLASRRVLGDEHIALEQRRVSAGSEVLLALADALGCESRGRVNEGELLRASRLRRAHDIRRGEQLLLMIGNGAVSMQALAEALGDAYVGQRLKVERLGDGRKYSGTLSRSAEGELQVVVE